MKNYGYNPELEKQHQSETDYLVGANSLPALFEVPRVLVDIYLPRGERQNIGDEKMDCASRSPINKLETDFTYAIQNNLFSKENEQWLRDNGYVTEDERIEFSDAFISILSGTTRQGNSLIKPIDTIRNYGLIPKYRLPQLDSFDDYYNPLRITDELRSLGLDFKDRFDIRYERATESQFGNLLEKESLCVGGFAWSVPFEGEYPRVDMPANHAFMLFKNPRYYAFDNYIDETDGDYIKKLAPDYDFLDIGYRVFVYKENKIDSQGNAIIKTTWFQKFINWLFNLIK